MPSPESTLIPHYADPEVVVYLSSSSRRENGDHESTVDVPPAITDDNFVLPLGMPERSNEQPIVPATPTETESFGQLVDDLPDPEFPEMVDDPVKEPDELVGAK